MMQKISKAELAERLEARVECADGGMEGLNTLLYGWKKFRKYGAKYRHALEARDWLYRVEVIDLNHHINKEPLIVMMKGSESGGYLFVLCLR